MSDLETLEKEIAFLKEKIELLMKARELERDLDEMKKSGKEYFPVPIFTPCPSIPYPAYLYFPIQPGITWTASDTNTTTRG